VRPPDVLDHREDHALGPPGHRAVAATGEHPPAVDLGVRVVVAPEGVGAPRLAAELAQLAHEHAPSGGGPVAARPQVHVVVEHHELEELEPLDGLGHELGHGVGAHQLLRGAADEVEVDDAVGQEQPLEGVPVASGDRVGVGGQQAGDTDLVDRLGDLVGGRTGDVGHGPGP
jgi:hypothetical protein